MTPPAGADPKGTRLDSWKEIAAYLKRDVRTVQRWEKTANLPIRRLQNPGLRAVFAYTADLDEWLRRQPGTEASPKPKKVQWIPYAVGGTILLLAIFLGLRRAGPAPLAPLAARPITSDPGSERDPDISPDGKQLVYVSVSPGRPTRILVRPIDSGEPHTVTQSEQDEWSPAWSPDGSKIAFLRGDPATRASLWVMSAGGGSERKIADLQPHPRRRTNLVGHLVAWNPDGRHIVVPDRPTPEKGSLFSIDAETGQRAALTSPGPANFDVEPSITPDGKTLLFNRIRGEFLSDAFLQPMDEPTAARKLPAAGNWNGTPRLLEDRREVLVCAGSIPRLSLWRVPADGSAAPVSLGIIGDWAVQSAVDRHTGRIVSRTFRSDADVVRFGLDTPSLEEEPILKSTFLERSAAYSPDGTQIAFISDRTGRRQLWVSDANGHSPSEWTQDFEADLPMPSWSADGSKIIFTGTAPEGNSQLYVADRSKRLAVRLTNDTRDYSRGVWSFDGKHIYAAASENSVYGIYRIPAGGGPAERVLPEYRYVGGIESSGKGLYVARIVRRQEAELVYVSLASREAETLARMNFVDDAWVTRDGVYVLDEDAVLRYRTHGGEAKILHKFQKRFGRGLSISPDGKYVLTALIPSPISDLLLLTPSR